MSWYGLRDIDVSGEQARVGSDLSSPRCRYNYTPPVIATRIDRMYLQRLTLVDSVSIRQERATATCDFLCLVDQFHIEPWDLPREFLSDLGGETVEVYF